ncbi:putative WRKY transcription factor 51, partial [Turnera subulata]
MDVPYLIWSRWKLVARQLDHIVMMLKCKSGGKKNKLEAGHRVAFRTKSELEIMDDGFKWRKYGKKSVKNSPNPRNYYKCSIGGCNVKKRVERDREDSRYVITTYE